MATGPIDQSAVETALAKFQDPESGRSVVEMEQLKEVRCSDGQVHVQLGLTTWSAPVWEETRQAAAAVLRERLAGVDKVEVEIVPHERPAEKIGQLGLTIKSVLAVGSGKGGVGKSTVAANLAYGLRNAGARVGLLDADVYGPSIPHLLGLGDARPQAVENRLQPIVQDGLRVMSMGFLVPADEAVVWRGPMLHGAITQFLRDTDWGDLDYLIIDMPPGTGDIALTLSQLLPLAGAIVVCTPQDVALLDAVKAIAMFRKVSIPVAGIVENMSHFLCPGCHERYDIFGSGGAEKKAAELEVPFLGEIPIQIGIRQRGDAGRTADNLTDDDAASYLDAICANLVRNLSSSNRAEPPLPSLSVL